MPQAKRQEAHERISKGLSLPDEEPAEPGEPSREYMLMLLMGLGMSRAEAEKEYLAQLATAEAAKREPR